MSQRFMTSEDAAQAWGVSARRVRKLLQDGRVLGAYRVGGVWLIPANTKKPGTKSRTY